MSKHRTTCITILLPQISKPNPLFHNHLKECKKYPDQGKKGMILVPVANSKCKHFLVNRNIILKVINEQSNLVLHRTKCKFPAGNFIKIAKKSINPLTLPGIRNSSYYGQFSWYNLIKVI